ncbi:MAG TPA: serine hydrolase [Rhodothermales bacterium]|nr:serine hydrolase [Rhodothermales bacterium]
MNVKILLLITALLVTPVLAMAHPIIIRHDREDSAYRDLGARYAGALCEVRVEDGQGVRVALGILIAPRWVLTAAHVAQGMQPGHAIRFDGQDYPVARMTLQPKWEGQEHDLALIYLQTPVAGAQPLPLYRWDDEAGQQIIFVGSGMSGNGQTGPTEEDGIIRGATNRVDEVAPEWLNFIFNAPDTPGVTDLEGISGPGDSGGPGILVRNGTAYLAGVSSGQDAGPTGGQEGRYGVIEYYTRVSHYLGWIEQTMQAVAEQDIVQGNLGETLDAYLSEQVRDGFSGSVLVATAAGVVLEKGYGLAERSRNLPNTGSTVFPLGSIVKVFTREAIQQLAKQGQLTLNDPLSTFFDDVPADKQAITIQHLLDHQAGLAAHHDREGDFEPMDRPEALRRIWAQELRFAPGTSRAYSNSGYTLLAAIIETVSGQSYPDFVLEKLIRPAGLTHTGFYRDPRWADEQVAIGYEARRFGEVNSPKYWPGPTWALMGSGGMGSTVRDLYTWMQTMLLQHGFTPEPEAESPNRTGQDYLDEAVAFAAGGGDYGHYAVTAVLPDGTTLVVMNNASKDGVEDLHILASLASLRYGGEPVAPPRPEALTATDLAETPAGQKMLAMIGAISAGTEAAARAFLTEHMDAGFQAEADAVMADFARLHASLGDDPVVDLVIQPSPYRVQAYVQNTTTGEWRKIGLGVERDAPHLMAGLSVTPEAPPAGSIPRDDCGAEWEGLPDSPVGQVAAALLTALCQSDKDVHRAFIETQLAPSFRDQFPMEDHLSIFSQMHASLGQATVVKVVEVSPHEAQVVVRGLADGSLFTIMLEVDAVAPHQVIGVGIEQGDVTK